MSNPQAIRPPAHLSRSDKAAFRRIAAHLSGTEAGVSEGQVDLIADLVTARRRITTLAKVLDAEAADIHPMSQKRILALASAINSTTALAHRIVARLGILELGRHGH